MYRYRVILFFINSNLIYKSQDPREADKKSQEAQDMDRKKTKLNIVLNKKPDDQGLPDLTSRRSSYAEIQLTSPTAKEAPKTQEYRSEVSHAAYRLINVSGVLCMLNVFCSTGTVTHCYICVHVTVWFLHLCCYTRHRNTKIDICNPTTSA